MAVSAIGDLRDEHGWTREGSRGLIVFKTISKGKGLKLCGQAGRQPAVASAAAGASSKSDAADFFFSH